MLTRTATEDLAAEGQGGTPRADRERLKLAAEQLGGLRGLEFADGPWAHREGER